MNYKVLYRQYRPANFSELVGQDHIKELLLKSITNKRLSHAYIFTGPRGTGKTSTAKIFAKTVNCENLINGLPCEKCNFCLSYNESSDIIEIDAASNNGVDEIREIRENVKILPTTAKYKIYIIDEVHMLSSSAWNAFLKTLEEPPSHVIFILATTEIQKVPITVLSRCQRFDFQRISDETIIDLLKKIIKFEKIKIQEEAIKEVALLADGGLRDALSILDQLAKLGTKITVKTIKDSYGIITTAEIENLFEHYFKNNIKEILNLVDNFKFSGVDSSILITKTLDYLLDLLALKKVEKTESKWIEELIVDLESCYYKTNKYTLIKATLLKQINEVNNKENVQNLENKNSEIISREIISEAKTAEFKPEKIISREIIQKNKIEDIINIRINNSFVEAKITLKKDFIKIWDKYIEDLFNNNEFKIGTLLKETKVEVVSPTNILVSTESYSNSVLLNTISDKLSDNLKVQYNISTKIVCLDSVRWQTEKNEYIKNKKSKKYNLIIEPENLIIKEVVDTAENIFGEELIEIN
ncbi:MAG: DNA polymerase III subunit gamma/tau [Bacilli bacterium]|nr:DNA polymerase III subunit gamma/tau [Bacilli bacterium]